MNLKHVSFAGVDERTDIERLQKIQEMYPFAEFGVLTSYHWNENGNRYLNPERISDFKSCGLNLSLHVCGSMTDEAHKYEGWDHINRFIGDNLRIFKRVQLNVSKRNKPFYSISPIINQEIIIQQKDAQHIDVFLESIRQWTNHMFRFSLLLDASGGNGIDTPIIVFDSKYLKVGYAGGINPDNVGGKLFELTEYPTNQDFWIDMESGVRTDDWFDLDKVEKVCQIANRFFNQPN